MPPNTGAFALIITSVRVKKGIVAHTRGTATLSAQAAVDAGFWSEACLTSISTRRNGNALEVFSR